MNRLIAVTHRIARGGAWFGGVLIVAAAFVIAFEVIIRKFFDMSIGGADELSTFALAISSAWAFSFTLLERAHIRIESLYVILPTRLCAVIDIVAHMILTTVAGLLAWYGFKVFQSSLEMGARTLSPLASPLAVPQFLWAVGLAFFLFVSLVLLLRASLALITGDLEAVQRLIGPRSLAQELQQEIDAVERHRVGGGGDDR